MKPNKDKFHQAATPQLNFQGVKRTSLRQLRKRRRELMSEIHSLHEKLRQTDRQINQHRVENLIYENT